MDALRVPFVRSSSACFERAASSDLSFLPLSLIRRKQLCRICARLPSDFGEDSRPRLFRIYERLLAPPLGDEYLNHSVIGLEFVREKELVIDISAGDIRPHLLDSFDRL